MTTDKKTLADAQPGGMVRLGDSLPPLPRMQRFTNLYGETYAYSAEQMWDYAHAALSAQPSPGGQGDVGAKFEKAWREAADIFSISRAAAQHIWNAALAARQPVGEPVAYTSETQLKAVRVCGDGIMSRRNAKWDIPLYAMGEDGLALRKAWLSGYDERDEQIRRKRG